MDHKAFTVADLIAKLQTMKPTAIVEITYDVPGEGPVSECILEVVDETEGYNTVSLRGCTMIEPTTSYEQAIR